MATAANGSSATVKDEACAFAPSFQYAAQEERDLCLSAAKAMPMRLNAAVLRLTLTKVDKTARAAFETWFGPVSDQKLNAVVDKFKLMRNSKRKPYLYYRGTKLPRGTKESIVPGQEPVAVYSLDKDNVAYWAQNKERDADPNYAHFFLGQLFFDGKTVIEAAPILGQSITRGAIFVHELSHAVAGTQDETYNARACYGSAACMEAAKADNPICLTNASNYQMYADFCTRTNTAPKKLFSFS